MIYRFLKNGLPSARLGELYKAVENDGVIVYSDGTTNLSSKVVVDEFRIEKKEKA